MLNTFFAPQELQDLRAKNSALSRSQAVIEFAPDGTILWANDNFLKAMGYTLDEVEGEHHGMFVDNAYRNSGEYKEFWNALRAGTFQVAEFKRFAKGGREIWIQASYNPVADRKGRIYKVVKYATDITQRKLQDTDNEGQIKAISKSQAVIEFTSEGSIVTANENFLNAMGYTLDEIKGKHHSMFVEDQLVGSNIDIFHKDPSHQRNMLARLTGSYRTSILVGGRSFNLVANPVTGSNGERLGVVVEWLDGAAAGLADAIDKSQAVIEFSIDGTIQNANKNFLAAISYSLDEIKGKHHSMFVEETYAKSAAYQQFWEALRRGEAQTSDFKRFAKGGREIWIQASYSPVLDLRGKVVRVVKTATDITKQKQAIAEINNLIAQASDGNLEDRIDTTQFDGFYGDMTRSMNGLMDAIETPINSAVNVLDNFSRGDLTKRLEGSYQGAFNRIQQALNSSIEHLAGMVQKIIQSAQSVNSAAGEIASGSSDLSMRTEQQASSLEETAASMEEITGTVKENARNATTANDLSNKANGVASEGGRVVEQAVTAMGSIERSSQKISDIISVIDEIAFQTNLLALNAAVEAARAGEAGKGFAVVASEVRSLAGRSASASKEIKALINESVSQVKDGAQLVNQAGETLKGIVSSVQQVAGIVSEIASASEQQANSIGEINSAVAQMDEVTQQNAALVEENTAAAQSMLEQAKALENLISFFKLDANALDAELQPATFAPAGAVRKAPAKPTAAPVKTAAKLNGKAGGHHAPAKAKAHVSAKESAHDGWEEF